MAKKGKSGKTPVNFPNSTGPNAPAISSKLKGGNNNRHQTPKTVESESYRKARGG